MNTFVIDVGSSSMRGIVFHDRGEWIARSRCEYRPTYGDNGVVEQPAESFLLALRSNVANVVKEASVPTCCSAFDWFRREFCPDLSFEQIGEIVEQKHNLCDPVVFLPYFQGRGTPNWDSEAKAAVCGITLSTSRGDLLYSLLSGVFAEVGENLENLSRYVGIDKGVISGGLTQTFSINQLQADMYGIPLSCSNDPESTALGALVVALAGQGIADPKETLALFFSTGGETVYRPNRGKHAVLQELKLRNNEVYRSLKMARANK